MADKKKTIFYTMRILLEETDKNHKMNASQICSRLIEKYELSCDIKTVYTDIRILKEIGLKIELEKGQHGGYYVGERDFDLAELKLLVDAVQSSKFITRERSEKLIRKLERLTSKANAAQLQRQVFIMNRIKTDNEAIYENVDAIHNAIHLNRQIIFKYSDWNRKKKMVLRRDGADYTVSPWALTWDDENYYLVGYGERPGGPDDDKIRESGRIIHYRVDKMKQIRISGQERLGKEQFRRFDLASYARKTFGMFGGEERKVLLEGEGRMAGVLIDRFGTGVMMWPEGEDRFRASVTVAVSPQFFGWLSGLEDLIWIVSPEDIEEEYASYHQRFIDRRNTRHAGRP